MSKPVKGLNVEIAEKADHGRPGGRVSCRMTLFAAPPPLRQGEREHRAVRVMKKAQGGC